MKRKYLDYGNWPGIEKSRRITFKTYQERFGGYASAVFVEKVREKLIVDLAGTALCLVDDGYTWVQRLLPGENWALTTMFDRNDDIIEWYFDITLQNGVDEAGEPFYDDLYLDVVVLPSGRIVLLDEDELKEALVTADITQSDFDLAYKEAEKIMAGMAKKVPWLTEMSFGDLNYFKALPEAAG